MSDRKKEARPDRPVAIVTGGLQGLGLGIVLEMLGDGFDVAIIDLPEDPVLPDEVSKLSHGGKHCRYYRMDIADLERHEPILAAIQADFGRMDCLVNNAGIAARPLTDILDLEVAAFDKSIDINLRGTFFLTQQFAKRLMAAGDPEGDVYRSIIIITSILAELVSTDRSQYCVSKCALSMVTRLFAARLASAGVHVHEIRPGFMQTPMTASAGSDTIETLLGNGFVPIPRWGQPEDVGRAVSELAAGRLPYMTGQPLWIAGGLNIAPAL
ncbi:3-ketoacyl-ACP reductase [Kineobactrum salinum]|uniref:3-ketoacyl-ACP reductase n=1 Tax=Kineobactrum salinum TaxID=2708301 RepID=A0A6C0U0L2_9GAMM|nr:3-ketoacyl-ACP reductase [Kineobactrum salinum]QIB65109.1 3-ketoacyl-ACP reductase [Kineobactrum salinum]